MRYLFLSTALMLSLPVSAAPAHVHGDARLEITLEGDTLDIHLETPLDGLLGFEHAPRSAAEKQVVQAMKVRLEQPERLFQIAAEAGCRAGKPEIESAIFDGKSSGHLDLDANYRWQCTKPSVLRDIATRLFAEFPRLKRIKVEFAGPNGQKSGRLTPQQPHFAW